MWDGLTITYCSISRIRIEFPKNRYIWTFLFGGLIPKLFSTLGLDGKSFEKNFKMKSACIVISPCLGRLGSAGRVPGGWSTVRENGLQMGAEAPDVQPHTLRPGPWTPSSPSLIKAEFKHLETAPALSLSACLPFPHQSFSVTLAKLPGLPNASVSPPVQWGRCCLLAWNLVGVKCGVVEGFVPYRAASRH